MDLFELVAKIMLDSSEYESGVRKAKGTFSTLTSGVKNGLATVAKVSGAAIAAGVAGVAALTKMGVEGYKSYEQLAGGAKLLWGDAYSAVAENAKNAYATVQMSQNDYLQQVNGFAVGLKTALGGNEQAAAKLAHNIVQAEADIVAATGATQENVQNAFNGIMKNNFSMVDNLGLGITATKEGFQTMIDSVNEYNAAHGKSTKYTIDNVADCQAALVDYVAMQGMAGYAGMEAANSIEGSVSMMKAAWENLVVGMADSNADMEMLTNNFVESAATAAKQLLPRIEQTLAGIGQLIEKMAPIIAEAVPRLVESVLPSLLSAGISLITALASGIAKAAPGIYNALLDAVYMALTDVFGMSEESANTFVGTVDGIIQDLIAFFQAIPVALNWMVTQAQTEGTAFNTIWETIKSVVSAAVDFIRSTIQLFTAILTGDWSSAWQSIQDILDTAVVAIYDIVSAGLELVWGFISEIIGKIVEYFSEQWNEIKAECVRVWDMIKTSTTQAWNNIKAGLSSAWNGIKSIVSSAINGVKSSISSGLEAAQSSVSSILDGIKTKFSSIWEGCKTIVKNAVTALKNALNFHWELPKLKLPHISVKGGVAPYGIGGKGSLPKFSIEWYKKAYDNAMILSKPTIFGYSAASGKFLGGGDGNGNEIVAGESYLMRLISNAVEVKNEKIVALLGALLEATVDGNTETVRALMADRTFAVGEREFARLVKQYA